MKCHAILNPPIAAALILLAAAGALATAFISQYAFGVQPCELCIWQRGPYWAALALAAAIVLGGRKAGVAPVGFILLALTFVTSAALAFHHVGVEQHWWASAASCGGDTARALTAADLREQLLATPVKRCDVIDWTFMGLSMATWSVPFSLALAVYAGVVHAKNNTHKN
jgi:disulfide bond formation protein DsbB